MLVLSSTSTYIPPELFAVFRPAPAQPVIEHGIPPAVHDPQSLVQSGWQHGPNLTLDSFCMLYGLSEEIRTKLHENGYTSADMLTFIVVPELKEMGFKYGEIAVLKAAMRWWCQSLLRPCTKGRTDSEGLGFSSCAAPLT
ncbi:uncharacterized protein F5891DRAFT_1179917 [Suillus fuscotomentosus]|uniref:Uncharacterized protein n=1 Tax=Suillus fuscotomentosus TaxID=1912939 RepID=A0AAD4HVV9_9AGAM|nr:uncharacterized protein F5891DRAFT_1179917 [Suillus fuscotomentosus]KAG1908399.1 hypothetical protein F5891DRAFT_1179917 [Suillus fuscotomentosus]